MKTTIWSKVDPGCIKSRKCTASFNSDKPCKLVLEENRKKLNIEIKRGDTVLYAEVEKCVIKTETGLRCDYMAELPNGEVYFIELKGRNVEDGVDQLKSSITAIRSNRKQRVNALVVCSKVKTPGTKRQKLIEEMLSENIVLITKTTEYTLVY